MTAADSDIQSGKGTCGIAQGTPGGFKIYDYGVGAED